MCTVSFFFLFTDEKDYEDGEGGIKGGMKGWKGMKAEHNTKKIYVSSQCILTTN